MPETGATAVTRSAQRLRVLVVDDHDVVHWGFRLMLTQQPWVERCVTASNGDDGVALARRYRPHVAVVDLFIGEESGALDNMLFKVAEFYEDEVENAVDTLSTLLEPLIMVVLGTLVGGIVIALYLPIFKLAGTF